MGRINVTISYRGELVDRHEAGDFYYKVTPHIRYGRYMLDDRERKTIINEVKKEMQAALKKVKP